MQLALPADIEKGIKPEDAQLGLALGLYVSGRLGLGRAAEVAGLHRMAFQQAMAKHRIPVDYTEADFHADVTAIESRRHT